jgi:RNA polymerase sigma factor (sigma-70 family)
MDEVIYQEYRNKLTEEQLLAEVYAVLGFAGSKPPGLFRTYDPAKYHGRLSHEDHFVNLFARKLKSRLRRAARRASGDCRRRRLYAAREQTVSTQEQMCRALLPVVLGCLEPRERAVIHLTYWEALSARKVGELLGIDDKTVKKVHDKAVGKLRRWYGVEES